MNLLLTLRRALALWPNREALVDGEKRFTYRQFAERVNSLASAFSARGLGVGQVVAVIAPNGHEFMEAYYASALIGAVCNPINFRLNAQEIAFVLNDSQAKIVIAHDDFHESVQAALDQAATVESVIWLGEGSSVQAKQEVGRVKTMQNRPAGAILLSEQYESILTQASKKNISAYESDANDLLHLYYTSGTTGTPKGVMLSHGNVTFHALAAIAELSLCESDVWLHVAPMFHLADAWATFAITAVGGKHVFVPYFRAEQVLATIEREKVTISNLIPTMLNLLLHEPNLGKHDYSSLRAIMSGGAPIAPEVVRRIIASFGCDYVQTYGMTETSPYLTLSLLKAHLKQLPEEIQLQYKCRTGRPFLGVDLKVVRENGQSVEANDKEVGEIIVKGPTVTCGYWKRPEATAQAIKDGWLYTGDLAVLDSEGYVNIVDRKKDMIITGGENVYSTEVEHRLFEHPTVLECAVIGCPDETWGERVVAFVVPKNSKPSKDELECELIEFVKKTMAHFKAPKEVHFVESLPKTGSGKLAKRLLKEQYLAALNV